MYVNGKETGEGGYSSPVSAVQESALTSGNVNTQEQGSKSTRFQFRKAVKWDAKLRLALAGPGGSGKTFTLLKLATELGGRIAVVDTEHGSASKYADQFQFDVLELDSFDPDVIPQLIADAAAAGYATLVIDSLTHFWNGNNGELDQVDQISARSKSGNSWAAWRLVSPKHNRMVDSMLSAPIHILVSMRVKTEWVVEKDSQGKSTPRKVGLQPVMRDGIEYEFDVCGDMDQENNLVVTKSRCPKLTGRVCSKPGREIAMILRDWLQSPEIRPVATSVPTARIEPSTAPIPEGPAGEIARRKIESGNPSTSCPWMTFGEMKRIFSHLREVIGESDYLTEMARYNWRDVNDIRSKPLAVECYHHLEFLAQRVLAMNEEVA